MNETLTYQISTKSAAQIMIRKKISIYWQTGILSTALGNNKPIIGATLAKFGILFSARSGFAKE
jgi:hypothetical protein